MKTNATPEMKVPFVSCVIGTATLLALGLVSSLHLEKQWDAIATGSVCAFGLMAFLFSLRSNPNQMKARPAVVLTAMVLGAAAVIAFWLLIRGRWH